ncbi:MAG: dihydrofolate synthase [Bacteroidetes bacterium]|jgi:dihydrofolate synthase/folylpolyglutamate synthase|nr:dihydrofolate synthase [Bacteroidota bacterium]
MEALLQAMEVPTDHLRVVHVAGTNGKGSTASMVAAMATAAGQTVGLHTSPHLLHVAERMRVDGAPAPEAWLADAVTRYRSLIERIGPSFFEATVALSLRYFVEAAVDLAVVEVGLGGRLDATNVLTPVVALITHIGLDHTDLLGDTLEAIAREKGGIIKPGVPCLTAATQPAVQVELQGLADAEGASLEVVQQTTQLHGAAATGPHARGTLRTPVRTYEGLALELPGAHQWTNARLAVRAVETLGLATDAAVRQGLGAVRKLAGLRGRLETLHTEPLVVADVAHNPEGLQVALRHLRTIAPDAQLQVLLGLMRDKDLPAIARLCAAHAAGVTPVEGLSDRAVPAADVAAALRAAGVSVHAPTTVAEGLPAFLTTADPSDALLATGSHQVVAPVVQHLSAA